MHPRRTEITEAAAGLMNRGGYVQTSVAELLAATGLEKGGLYHHFASKEDIALAAFDHVNDGLRARMADAARGHATPRAQLAAMVDAALLGACAGELPGGCPMINLAVDAGERHPRLRARAAEAMQELRDGARMLLAADPPPGAAEPGATADLVVTLIEGALVVREITGDDGVVGPARAHVRTILGVEV